MPPLLLVFLAETGTLLHISKPIKYPQELAKEIEHYVPINSQILLTANGEPWRGGDHEDGSVFVFNRLVLDPKYTSNATAQSIDILPPVPSSIVANLPPVLPSSSISERTSVQERVTPYMTVFKSHVAYGKALLEIAQKHFATCQKLLEEQRIQTKALDIAIQNLDSHAKSTFETFNAFNTHAQKEFTKHSSLLHSCPADLNTLAQIPIHHSIQTDNRKLDEYVPKEKLYAWVSRCQESHDHLLQKTNQLMDSMQEIRAGCNIEQLKMTGVEFPKLVKLLETSSDVLDKMGIIYTNFERDATRVCSTCQDIISSPNQAEMGGRIQAIDNLYTIHSQEYLPEITKYDRYVRETVVYFNDSKVHLTQVLQSKLQTISHFQSLIAAVTPSIATLTNALNLQSEALLQLLHVHRMAPAWGATLVEIVRRKEYVRIFLQKAKDMADILNQFRTQEQRRRDTFKSEILRYIPAGLIQGLDEAPPYCEISVSNTKDSLPNLVADDIQAFERMISSIKPSHISGDPSVASDSISKLQATMLKMLPQLENIGLDFERIVLKTGFYAPNNNRKLEEENKSLKKQLSSVKSTPSTSEFRPTHTAPSAEQSKPQHYDASLYPKQEEIIKAYESRIKSLERVLQERYNTPTTPILDSASIEECKQLRLTLAEEKKKTKDQAERIKHLEQENQGFRSQVATLNDQFKTMESQCKDVTDALLNEKAESEKLHLQISNFEKESTKQKQLLVQVSAHLHSCLASLKSSEDSMVHLNSIVIPDSIHSDNLQQMMRKVEDDIISQMALLANMKALNESVGVGSSEDAQSVAHEMVGLLQRISDLELVIKETEAELTQVQAKEAVVEAECNSVKKILSKTTESLEQHQTSIRSLSEDLEKVKMEKEAADGQCVRLMRMHEEKDVAIRGLEERIAQQSRKIPEQGLQLLLHAKDSQLRVCQDALEDWAIISKLSVDFMNKCYTDFSQMQSTLGMNPSPEISCRDILALEIESLPEELDQFLAIMTVLIKQTYEKVVAMAVMSSSAIVSELRTQFKSMKFDLGKRITFQRFQVSSLCLFLPTKNPVAWAAFHVDSPHYFLAPESHPSFDTRIKKREWILGTITDISSFTVGRDGDNNRFGLANGTVYHVCSAIPFQ